jgi:hypothetical protein
MRRILFVLLALALAPVGASAQACVGRPPLAGNSQGNFGLGASFLDNAKGFGANATFGGPLFGVASFDYFDIDNSTLSLKAISGGAGYEMSVGDGSVSVCPGLSITYAFGLEVLGVDVTALEIAPGVAAGLTTEVSPTISVTPFAQASFVYSRVMVDAGPLGEEDENETAGLLVLGASLGFNNRLSVGPRVAIPIAEDGGDTAFGVFLSVAVGR